MNGWWEEEGTKHTVNETKKRQWQVLTNKSHILAKSAQHQPRAHPTPTKQTYKLRIDPLLVVERNESVDLVNVSDATK
jgi:hypothetical protein